MENINSDDISIEALKNLLTSEDNTSLFADLDISKAIEESENLIKKNVDDLMNQFKTIKTEISFINNSNNPDPVYAHTGDSGFDIRANLGDTESQLILRSFERSLIPTGLHFEIPKGYDMEIKSRSGLAVKHGITVLTGTIDCFTSDMLIKTIDGDKMIEDIRINEIIYSYNLDNGQIEKDLITNIHNTGEKEILEIMTEDGNLLKISENTEILTKNGWKLAINLKESDEILVF